MDYIYNICILIKILYTIITLLLTLVIYGLKYIWIISSIIINFTNKSTFKIRNTRNNIILLLDIARNKYIHNTK